MPNRTPVPLIISEAQELKVGDTLNGSLFGRVRQVPDNGQDEDLTSTLPPTSFITPEKVLLEPVSLDLSKENRVAVLLGRGNTGKTTLARLIAEIAARLGGSFFAAACDPGARALAKHLTNVQVPETSDPTDISSFLISALEYASSSGVSGLIDMGAGGEATLMRIDEKLGFLELCKRLKIVPVFIYTVATGVDDLSILATFQQRKLWPEASAIIFNEMTVPSDSSRSAAFDLIRRQSCVRTAMEKGAPQLWLPALNRRIFMEIERKQLQFGDAASGNSSSRNSLGPLNRADQIATEKWMKDAENEMKRIATWLPGWRR